MATAPTRKLWCVWSWICAQSEFKKIWYFDTNCNECDDNFLLRDKLRRHVLARSRWSICTAIRGASVISFSLCVCVLCLFLSNAFFWFSNVLEWATKAGPCHLFIVLLWSLKVQISTTYIQNAFFKYATIGQSIVHV